VLTLALGIGANSAIFSVVNGVLLRPLPYRDPDQLVRLFTSFRGSGTERYAMSQPEFMDYKGLTHVFENAAAFTGAGLTMTGTGEPERVRGIAATRDLFPVLGVAAAQDAEGNVRIALGAVASRPFLVEKAGEFLKGKKLTDEVIAEAAGMVANRAKPMDNTDMDLYWRKEVADDFAGYALRELRGDDMRETRLRTARQIV
jgi:hypothetical protein